MATKPIPPPDIDRPQSPPEAPPGGPPVEQPWQEPDEITPLQPDNDLPGGNPQEF